MTANATTLSSRTERTNAVDLEGVARKIRRNIIESLYHAGSGHAGSSLSIADLVAVLYFDEMNLEGEDRDRFVLSKGHAAPALYAAFACLGWINESELATLRKLGSRLQGHPDMTRLPFLDGGTGALGQGASIAAGYAIGARLKGSRARSYTIVGDGESQEGQIWELALFAPNANLGNLCLIVDSNRLQNETWVDDTLRMDPMADKWRDFGWHAIEIDGHNIAQIQDAFASARETPDVPTAIIANTVKGKGVSFMENDNAWHGGQVKEEHLQAAMKELAD